MNSLIEVLNLWGPRFTGFALPALVQSSILIALLLALETVLRQRVRATVRHGLWLLVLVKLVLPTSLASPASVAYWLPASTSAPARPGLRASAHATRPARCDAHLAGARIAGLAGGDGEPHGFDAVALRQRPAHARPEHGSAQSNDGVTGIMPAADGFAAPRCAPLHRGVGQPGDLRAIPAGHCSPRGAAVAAHPGRAAVGSAS